MPPQFQYRKIARLICVHDIHVLVYNYEDNRSNTLSFSILHAVSARDINISPRAFDNSAKMQILNLFFFKLTSFLKRRLSLIYLFVNRIPDVTQSNINVFFNKVTFFTLRQGIIDIIVFFINGQQTHTRQDSYCFICHKTKQFE